jgi:hypothetical protein
VELLELGGLNIRSHWGCKDCPIILKSSGDRSYRNITEPARKEFHGILSILIVVLVISPEGLMVKDTDHYLIICVGGFIPASLARVIPILSMVILNPI